MVAESTIGALGGLVVRQAQRDVASVLDGLSNRLFDAGGIKAIEVLMSDRRCCHGAFDDGSFNGEWVPDAQFKMQDAYLQSGPR
jgi:hypothetical protein